MSGPFAIAAVTTVLKDLLNDGLINHDFAEAVGTVLVTALPPDRVASSSAEEKSQLNVFLYHVTPNSGWSNVGLPSRDATGERLTNPPLALNLHYLITAYGKEELHAEALLGYAMQLLHETPVLTRRMIQASLNPALPSGVTLPALRQLISISDLAEQVELIKISPQTMTMDEMSKLWTAAQTHYRPTAAYQISVVLIQANKPTRSPMPVLTRGEKDQGVTVQPNLLPAYPTLQKITLPNKQPAICLSTDLDEQILTLHGAHLTDGTVSARFTNLRTAQVLELAAQPNNTDSEVKIKMPLVPSAAEPEQWFIGFYTVAAVVRNADGKEWVTGAFPFALAPRIISITATLEDASTIVKFTVTCSPKATKTQNARLMVKDREISAAWVPSAAPERRDTLLFETNVDTLPRNADILVRLNVDGVESLMINRQNTPPTFNDSHRVHIP